MLDVTQVIAIDSLSQRNLGDTVYIDGVLQYDSRGFRIAEPAEYTSRGFRVTVGVENLSEEDAEKGAYIVAKGELTSMEENPTYDSVKIHLEEYEVFNAGCSGDLSIQKTADAIMSIMDEYGAGTGLPKRFVIEQVKNKDADYETAIETIQRLIDSGHLFEPQRGFIARVS